MAETTDRLGLPLLAAGQAHKEITHNEALLRLDTLVGLSVEAIASAPPAFPADGAVWVVGPSATGAWAQHSGEIAHWRQGSWAFLMPLPGYIVWNRSTTTHIVHDGSEWRADGWPVRTVEVSGKTVLSDRQPAIPSPSGGGVVDVEVRLAVAALLAAARTHGLIET